MFVSNGGTQTSDITNNEEEDGKQFTTSLFQFSFANKNCSSTRNFVNYIQISGFE